MLLSLYKNILALSTPVVNHFLARRLARGKEDAARLHERRGQAGIARPEGRIIWCHAASVGESISLLPVVEWMLGHYPTLQVLVTTGTVTSAKMMAARLPARAIHQYMPVDHPLWVQIFLATWRPSMVIWSESELWPNMLQEVRKNHIPALLLNARMSENSFQKWSWVKGTAQRILSVFDLCLAQDAAEAERLKTLGAKDVRVSVNLKYAAKALPTDDVKQQQVQAALSGRKALVWASTHPGDEEAALRLHQQLKKDRPDFLTVIVPRHPVRGAEIASLIQAQNLCFSQRSSGALPQKSDDVYVADTLGELGIFFRLIPWVVMGGSLQKIGGHNPIEPAQLGCTVFFGQSRHNFKQIIAEFEAKDALVSFTDENDLQEKVLAVMRRGLDGQAIGQRALQWTEAQKKRTEEIFVILRPLIDRFMMEPS